MTTHVNFYENLPEAQMRLRNTIVLYDGDPYYILAITNHMKDGVFRVYLQATKERGGRISASSPLYTLIQGLENYSPEDPALGKYLDGFVDKGVVLRKQMNSPLFNKFRPFPLGMVNLGEEPKIEAMNGRCYYIERQPTRGREQGLTQASYDESLVMLGTKPMKMGHGMRVTNMFTGYFNDMIHGKYPTAKEAYEALIDPSVTNEAIAFHRLFAYIRGPVDTLFLAYKDKVIGQVVDKSVRLGREFKHLKEATEELNLGSVIVRS